jgi:MFS transporter, SHS family, sialic acid transporter
LYLPELFPTRVRATGQGFGYNFGRVIAAAFVLSRSFLMHDVFHGDYARAGAVISLIYLVALVVIWLAPETHGQLPD